MLTDSAPGNATRATSLDRARLRAGAFEAKRRYPGPVGELVAAELLAWEGHGFRFGGAGRVTALLEHLIPT